MKNGRTRKIQRRGTAPDLGVIQIMIIGIYNDMLYITMFDAKNKAKEKENSYAQ